MLLCLAAFLTAAAPLAAERLVTVAFHPQPRPARHVRVWSATVCNRGTAPVSVSQAEIAQETAGRLAILNPYARSFEQTRRPRSRAAIVGNGLAAAGAAFTAGVATGAIEYEGDLVTWAALVPGGWRILNMALSQGENRAFVDQPFWDGRPIAIGPGECAEAAVAALRPEDKAERRRIEARSMAFFFRDWSQRQEAEMPESAPPEISPQRLDAPAEILQPIADAAAAFVASGGGARVWYGPDPVAWR